MPTAIKTKNEFQVLHILVRYTDDDFDKQRVIRMSNINDRLILDCYMIYLVTKGTFTRFDS